MRQLQPVIWAKGTFLTPNHMQSQDLYWDSLLGFQAEALGYCSWGLLTLDIDTDALANGSLNILSASGLFPDGLAFEMPSPDAPPPPKPLHSYLQSDDVVDLYLAIPPLRLGGLNVAGPGQNADTRFVAEYLDIRDENNGRVERPVQVARKNFRIMAKSELSSGAPALQIARVRKGERGEIVMDPHFIPQLLNISASPRTMTLAQDIVELLTARSNDLSNTRRERASGLAEFTSSETASFWLLYTVNTYLPLVRHILETRHGHPEVLFSTLLSIAGALTTFAPDIDAGTLPSYDHDDLTSCFQDLEIKLRTLLDTAVQQNFTALAMRELQPYIYGCSLSDEDLDSKMFLAIKSDRKEAELLDLVPQRMIVTSGTDIQHHVKRALAGLALRHVPVPPSAIRVKLQHQYFSLNQTGDLWESVRRGRSIAAYVPGDFPNPQMELIVLRSQVK
jgi:type VI secretion system protein ImpJ